MNEDKDDDYWILKIIWLALFGDKEMEKENK
jgi:hypothetical protein